MYKTGDLARYRPDGNIEFLGRLDHQVKLRGFRIELGEIEAVLGSHPGVRGSAITIQEDNRGEKRIVAFVTTADGTGASTSELRSFLRQKLPEFMIPASFVFLNALPVSPNGKLDRRALPEHEAAPDRASSAFPEPKSEIEQAIAATWQEVLQVDHVSRDDNFFDIGGHSLLMARVHSNLRDSLAADVSMIDMFRFPTISSLARHLSGKTAEHTFIQQVQDRARQQREAISRRQPLQDTSG